MTAEFINPDRIIEPISVEERLPTWEDADPYELCWWWRTDGSVDSCWEKLIFSFLVRQYNQINGIYKYTHWLPHSAIPDPSPNPW